MGILQPRSLSVCLQLICLSSLVLVTEEAAGNLVK